MARLGKITTQPCLTDPVPPDPRCADPAFALSHPDICPPTPRLVIRPSFALACKLGSVQFKASYIDEHYIETDVTDQTTFQSSDWNIAVVGAASGNAGNATGLSTGTASITGAYQGLTAFGKLTILGDNCCDDQNVAMIVMVDRTRSMNQLFSGAYATKLDFAKAAAQRFIGEVNSNKDVVGLMTFTATGHDVLSSPVADKNAVAALVPGIAQTQQLTTLYSALTAAIAELNAVTADLRVLVLISDGEDKDDSYSTEDNPIALLQEFKDLGGIVITLGVRAHDFGYNLLSAFSTGGFFLNAHDTVASVTLDYLSALKSYICASNCTPEGDTFEATGTLNYCGFANWNVVDGHVDLIGNGFLDLLPDNGLYVDLAGSRPEHKGKMESKDAYAIEAGKTYRIALRLAGNNRVDATPNVVRVQAYSRNTDTIPDQNFSTAPVLSNGAGSADVETYEYAFSYVNVNGETILTPPASITNEGAQTFTITLTPDVVDGASEQPSLVRLWKREVGTTKWYLIAEGDPDSDFQDTLNNARLAAALLAGTIDSCNVPTEQNTTGTPIVLFEQDITIDDFRQGFEDYNPSFVAATDADVWFAIQQTETPEGYDATGLLMDSVQITNVTDDTVLLDDDFETENTIYVPPGCGTGTNYVLLEDGSYGYMSGYGNSDCCSYEVTNGGDVGDLILPGDADSNPSVTVTAETLDGVSTDAYNSVDGDVNTSWSGVTGVGTDAWWQCEFSQPKLISSYQITAETEFVSEPTVWVLEGSNDDLTWVEIDSQVVSGVFGHLVAESFSVSTAVAYKFFRFTFDAESASVAIAEIQLVGRIPDEITFANNCPPCPTEFPGVQTQDPTPLLDNEVTQPPDICFKTADVTRACATGYLYVPTEPLAVVSTTVSQCENASVGVLDGLRWEMPVLVARSHWHGSICANNVGGAICDPCSCDPPDQIVVLRGDAGVTYNVTLRFRGIIERQPFSGIVETFDGTDDCFVQISSYPGLPATNPGNAYYLITTAPDRIYVVNASLAQFQGCALVDYTVTIPLNAASSVSLLARSRDNLANLNRVPPDYLPGVVPGIVNRSTAEPNEPFPGPFLQMDVVSVIAQ